MSAHSEQHDQGHIAGYHGSYRAYLTGFVLAVILTAIPFAIVMSGGFESRTLTAIVVVGFAAVQMIVHMVYFLHMNPRAEGGWTVISLVFTLIVLIIAVAGTIWVMYHMDANMMPGMATSPPGS